MSGHSPNVLIDGDILVYRTGFAGQQTLVSAVLPDGAVVVDGAKNKTECLAELANVGVPEADVQFRKEVSLDSLGNVFHSLDVQLESILGTLSAKSSRVFITGSGNYRELLAKTLPYKGNRVAEKPVRYQELRDRLVKRWGAEVCQGHEADDAIAAALTGANEYTVAVSIDKDLRQVPGWHWNWLKDDGPQYITHMDGMFNLFCQVLSGDATDNIPGLHKVGPKTAEKWLLEAGCQTWDEYCALCLGKYAEQYGEQGLDRFIETFNLVYLCRTQEEIIAQQTSSKAGQGLSPAAAHPARWVVPTVPEDDLPW